MSRILIVDNNLVDLEAMKEALADAGFPVAAIDVAMDAPEAIRLLDSLDDDRFPELILLDLRLSVGSGLDVLRHVRTLPRLLVTPVVVLSSVLKPEDRDACLAAGATRACEKPRRFADQVALAREWRSLVGATRPSERLVAVAVPGVAVHPAGAGLCLQEVSRNDIMELQDRLRPRLRTALTLEDAAQALVRCLCLDFGTSAVLTRFFMTLPFSRLPEELRRAAWSIVERQALQGAMRESTPVLTLLGTCGREPEWCDRRTSRGHAAIPLSSRSFVDSIPMIARMLQDMGIELGLQTDADPHIGRLLGAGWVGLFYVEDALVARDEKGRRIIPAVDFVERHGVRTVFGLGKAYANGTIASLVVFANALVPRARVEALVPIMNQFKAQTMELVSNHLVFRADPPHGRRISGMAPPGLIRTDDGGGMTIVR